MPSPHACRKPAPMRSIRLLLLSLAMSIVLPAYAALAAAVSITDDAGRTVEMAQPAQRIVLTDGMGLIGLAAVARNPVGLLAGWNKGRLDTDVLEAFRRDGPAIDAVPDIGELRSGSAAVEALIALRPDLVVLDPYYRSAVAIRQLEAAGIAVAVLALTPSVRDAEPAYGIKRLSMLIGREAEGQAFSDFVGARLERIRARLEGLGADDRPLVLLEAHAGRGACCLVAGAGQGIGDFVDFVGGRNLGADLVPGMAGQISAEYVLAADPAVYIGTGGAYMKAAGGLTVAPSFIASQARASLDAVLQRPGLAGTGVVSAGRAHGLWHGLAISGINIVAIEAMARWVHPERFADLDPAATLAEIDRRFLAVPLTGTMWVDLAPAGVEARP
ncbi:ABC transporter substrate-binding protein [Hoeflea sp. EC-HK425]|nr:ABC transporter substrate-binding protein [Hoeflea sp. EC-HK425]